MGKCVYPVHIIYMSFGGKDSQESKAKHATHTVLKLSLYCVGKKNILVFGHEQHIFATAFNKVAKKVKYIKMNYLLGHC